MMVEWDDTAIAATAHSVTPRVLLVEGESKRAARIADELRGHLADLEVRHVRSLAEATRALARDEVDLIVAAPSMSDGGAERLLDMFVDQGPIFVYVPGGADAEELERGHPRLLDCVGIEGEASPRFRSAVQYLRAVQRLKAAGPSADLPSDVLRRVRQTISRVNHDLNNPLSIISGNAQLLRELVRTLDPDGDLVQPIQDIEEASLRVSGILRRLVELKDALPVDERSAQDVRSELRDLRPEG